MKDKILWYFFKDRVNELAENDAKILFDRHDCPLPCPIDVLVENMNVLDVHKTGVLLVNGERLTQEELSQLKAEVRAFKNFRLYEMFQNTLKQKAIELGLKNSEKWETTLAGKMMLHSLGIMKSMVETIDLLVANK